MMSALSHATDSASPGARRQSQAIQNSHVVHVPVRSTSPLSSMVECQWVSSTKEEYGKSEIFVR